MFKPLFFTVTGIILLLAGMNFLREGLKKFAGSYFQEILHKLTVTSGKGFISGIVVTAFLQSSTALTVMAVSLVDAELICFENTLGLILGSNIGSTLTSQLMAFPLDKISIWLIVIGSAGFVLIKVRTRFLLLSLAGIGVMFFSLSLLEAAMIPITGMSWVQNSLHSLHSNHFYCILAGTFFSALLHSSSAATGIAMVLTEEGWLSLPASFAFILGANIGTCFTALIVSFFASRSAQKVAIFHVLINVFGVIVFYPFLSPFTKIITLLGDNLSRQVANTHTFFNLASSLLVLPLLPLVIRLLNRLR